MTGHDPAEMTDAFRARIGRLPALTRDRILERACILHANGFGAWRECDAEAERLEMPQRELSL